MNIDGILLLDKPVGLSSNAILQKVKKLFKAKKAGHTGSLDPIASGMLPICFGEATKFSRFLLDSDKAYCVKAQLGIKTTTGDTEGEIIEKKTVPALSTHQLGQVLQQFCGPLLQVPPMFSALKHQGQPLYKLARKGIEVKRQARRIQILAIKLLDLEKDNFSLYVHCSKGTYIRTLIEDIGDALGCGGHVISLRRLSCGPYRDGQMITYDHLQTLAQQDLTRLHGVVQPIISGLTDMPILQLKAAQAFQIRCGQVITINEKIDSQWVCLTENNDRFLGVGEILADGRVAAKRMIA